jgi:hypothetical protein
MSLFESTKADAITKVNHLWAKGLSPAAIADKCPGREGSAWHKWHMTRLAELSGGCHCGQNLKAPGVGYWSPNGWVCKHCGGITAPLGTDESEGGK